jgi:hypothetical protein
MITWFSVKLSLPGSEKMMVLLISDTTSVGYPMEEKKMVRDIFFIPDIKINSMWLRALSMKGKTLIL